LPAFADRGCHLVSVTDPYGRILGFLDRSRYFSKVKNANIRPKKKNQGLNFPPTQNIWDTEENMLLSDRQLQKEMYV
jgi:hypothetical protein